MKSNNSWHEMITSKKNPQIRQLVKFQQKSSERKKENIFIIEGLRYTKYAFETGFKLVKLFAAQKYYNSLAGHLPLDAIHHQTVVVHQALFDELLTQAMVKGVIAVFERKQHTLSVLQPDKSSVVVVLDGVEKPGNIGAVLRTAAAARVLAVIVVNCSNDIYSNNIIHNSLGAIFYMQVISSTNQEALSFLNSKKFSLIAAIAQKNKSYFEHQFSFPCALLMGSEDKGLSKFWWQNAHHHLQIPMFGSINSLNISVSCGVLVYETLRQQLKPLR